MRHLLGSDVQPRRRLWVVLAITVPLFVAGATFTMGGLGSSEYPADVNQYHVFANKVVDDGLVPYDDFFMEYPPGALLTFVPPALLPDDLYTPVFKWLMCVSGLLSLAIVCGMLVRRCVRTVDLVLGAGLVALAPLLLGHVYLNRYDPFAALLGVAALSALLVGRVRVGGALLAVAFTTKVFAATAVPVVAIRLFRRGGRSTLVAGGAAFAAVTVLAFAPFAAVGLGGLRASFVFQAERLLQTESLGGSVILAADRLGLYDAEIVPGLSIDLAGGLPDTVALLSTLVSIAAIVLVVYAYARGSDADERFVLAFAASVLAFTAFSKALSPQFLAWLIPLVALAGGRSGRAAAPLLALASVATHLSQHAFEGLEVETWGVWTLVVRNALLVSVFALLVRSLLGSRGVHPPGSSVDLRPASERQ